MDGTTAAPAMPAAASTPTTDIEQIVSGIVTGLVESRVASMEAHLEAKLSTRLDAFQRDIQHMLGDKVSRAEVDTAIQNAIRPLADQLSSLQVSMQTIVINTGSMKSDLAHMSGELKILTSMRSNEFNAVSQRADQHDRALQVVESAQAALLTDMKQVRRDLYGSADAPGGPLSLFEQLDKLTGSIVNLRESVDAHFVAQQTQIDELQRTVDQWRSTGKALSGYAKGAMTALLGTRTKQVVLAVVTMVIMAVAAASGNRDLGNDLIEFAQTQINLPTLTPVPTLTPTYTPTAPPLPWLDPSLQGTVRRTPTPTAPPLLSISDTLRETGER